MRNTRLAQSNLRLPTGSVESSAETNDVCIGQLLREELESHAAKLRIIHKRNLRQT